jgi:hypothetical protein
MSLERILGPLGGWMLVTEFAFGVFNIGEVSEQTMCNIDLFKTIKPCRRNWRPTVCPAQ